MQGDDSDPWSAPALSQPMADEGRPAPARSAWSGLLVGDVVDPAGRYRVLSVLGRGGMGEVVLAEDTVLGRQVAIKTSLIGGAAMERLLAEATLTALLEHAAVVPVYDAGRRSDGTPFYVMRVVRGRTLADAVAARDHPELDLGPRIALCRHVLEAARAVAFAHRRGVVHRDRKPTNLRIGEFGETQVADWGLAATLDAARGAGEVALAFDVSGDLLALGAAQVRWRPPAAPRPVVLGAGAGIAAVEVAPGGQRLLLGRGDGVAEEISIGDGMSQRRQVVCSGPVKQFAFEPGGDYVQIVCSGPPGVGRWRWPALVAEPHTHDRAGRRMGVLRSGTRWLLDSVQSLVVQPPAPLGRPLRQLGPGFLDGATCGGGGAALLTGGRDQLWRLDDATATESPRLRPIARAPASVAVTCGAALSAFGDASAFAIADLEGAQRLQSRPAAPRILRLQLSPDDALVASGHLDGRVLVFRSGDGLLLATLRGHAERVSSLAFAERRLLVTGSWDGTARL